MQKKIYIILGLIFVLAVFFVMVADNVLVTQSDLENADAIIVISGGRGERVEHASHLFQQGFADTLIVSGCPGQDKSIVQANYMKEKAMELGVPGDKIVLDVLARHGLGTGEQAKTIRKIIERNKFKRVILVTTDFHTSRANMIFKRALKGLDTQLLVAHPDQGILQSKGWWYKPSSLKIVIMEVIKYIWYWISY